MFYGKDICRCYPIVLNNKLIDPFVKQNRMQVTLIACSDVAKAAISVKDSPKISSILNWLVQIPYVIGPIAAANSENFKMIMAQKIYTQYTIDLHHEVVIKAGLLIDDICL